MAKPSKNTTPYIQNNSSGIDVARQRYGSGTDNFYSTSGASSLLDPPRDAGYSRRMLTWKTPHLGYVQMYINPQQLDIQEKKIITPIRTKGGYVIQYAGEDLITISIRGTTGSGGMEGINILRAVYRSEQDAFTGIAQNMEQNLASAELYSLFKGTGGIGTAQIQDVSTLLGEQLFKENVFNIFDQPFPTLASLAANIELFFQGVLYKGFFTNFSVQESAENPGIFNYDLGFTAYSRQGTRRNFMPWHRQPKNPASVDANPLSFDRPLEPIGILVEQGGNPTDTEAPSASDTPDDSDTVSFGVRRDFKVASLDGKNVNDIDFIRNPPRPNR